jgi:hypothetical protein
VDSPRGCITVNLINPPCPVRGYILLLDMLLEYLVPSRARRELLRAVRSGASTIRQLSRSARVPYSSAHREMNLMVRAGLVLKTRSGNGWLCSWNSAAPDARALDPLLGGSWDDTVVVANLKRWGAPLIEDAPSATRLSLEETLARAARLARRRPDVARVWPVVLALHHVRIDLPELMAIARRDGEKRALGLLLDLTSALLGRRTLSRAAARLRDGRDHRVEDFFLLPLGPRARALSKARTPPIARRWRFQMNMTLEDFATLFRKFIR